MDKYEFIKQAIDSTNGFFSTQSEAVAINPGMYDMRLRDYVRQNVVIAPLAEQYNFRTPGATWTVTVDDTPSAASVLTETVDVPISAFSTRNVTFTPAEYGARYQLSYAEAARSFFDVAERMVNKLGYQMAIKKDGLAYTTLLAGAGTTALANGVSAATAIASTDTLALADISKAIAAMQSVYYSPFALVINHLQHKQLMDLQVIQQANTFGSRTVFGSGQVGVLFGLQVIVSHSVTTASSRASALILGKTLSGESPFGLATKRDAMIERDKNIAGRYLEFVGTEEYQFQVIHPSGVYALTTYSA